MLLYASLAMSFITTMLTLFFIPESPKYLHATGQYESSRQVLSYMASVNGVTENNFNDIRFAQEPSHLTTSPIIVNEVETISFAGPDQDDEHANLLSVQGESTGGTG